MITLHLTLEEAASLLSIAAKLESLVPCDRAKQRSQVQAFTDANPNVPALELARQMKVRRLYSRTTSIGDIANTVEARRGKLTP